MTIRRLSREELLALNKFAVQDGRPHIVVDPAICRTCRNRACLVTCPARCCRLNDDVRFEHAGCLECGLCRILCKDGGVTAWNYPDASFGVTFRCS